MPDPQENPTDPRPDQATTGNAAPDTQTDRPEEQSPDQAPASKPTQATESQPDKTTSTQQNMGDGAGIRGDYGDASQTNGLEGGPDETETDTELTGS
ncbi:hypothetical protein Q5H93_20795 [Hymenobacter sp. ASUV-10]|uniref:Uncharacterized protein n=1 Tax=Hymenobacter aranciens TaxID=3063996 RepID=A0ABT9BJL6_9BACT|nr:hypothetical protein [Hymenobacter sp. ASUV-10]MDO7877197.1 hypothetical protein [Hymenobacter sp. ASUV-10]